MSRAFYTPQGIRFVDEQEIRARELFVAQTALKVESSLSKLNKAWTFHRWEGPVLTPADALNREALDNEIWKLEHKLGAQAVYLRPETTASSYVVLRYLLKGLLGAQHNPPICVWQEGLSFRRETNDGASPAKLRFNEFRQLEFQCVYRADSKAPYMQTVMASLASLISRFVDRDVKIQESDRLPYYSSVTQDIVVWYNKRWTEVASISIRTDFELKEARSSAPPLEVLEIAIGTSRIVEMMRE